MKRRYIVILIIGLATWLCACETEMMGYEGESGIYFMMQKPPASGYGDPFRDVHGQGYRVTDPGEDYRGRG